MPSPASLAHTSIRWCLQEIESPAGGSHGEDSLAQLPAQPIQNLSREALKAAFVALLRALSDESDSRRAEWQAHIATQIEDDTALAELDLQLAQTKQTDRASALAERVETWLHARATGGAEPRALRTWMVDGWPDTSVPGGKQTFYQAYFRALHPAIRREQEVLDSVLSAAGISATAWRQWAIREAEAGSRRSVQRPRSVASLAVGTLVIVALLVGGVMWWQAKVRNASTASHSASEPQPVANSHSASTPITAPPATPTPARTLTTAEPTPTAPALTPAPGPVSGFASKPPAPRDPFAEGLKLLDAAEQAAKSNRFDESAASMRRAQALLEIVYPANDATLGDALSRVGRFWESREDWAEAARVHQKAVRAYEKTPTENAAPQLDAVNRWASALRHAGRNTEAARVYRTLLRAYESTGPGLQVDAATVAHNLANVVYASGDRRGARIHYEQALSMLADLIPGNEAATNVLGPIRRSFENCLRELGVSETQIQTETQRLLKMLPPDQTTAAEAAAAEPEAEPEMEAATPIPSTPKATKAKPKATKPKTTKPRQ